MLWNVMGFDGLDELGTKGRIRRVFRYSPSGELLDGDNMDKHGDDSGDGMNALRGHANVQGITDMCLYSQVLPGYLSAPNQSDTSYTVYRDKRTPKALHPNQMNFPQNFPKWFNSLMKAWYGDKATKENDFAFDLRFK